MIALVPDDLAASLTGRVQCCMNVDIGQPAVQVGDEVLKRQTPDQPREFSRDNQRVAGHGTSGRRGRRRTAAQRSHYWAILCIGGRSVNMRARRWAGQTRHAKSVTISRAYIDQPEDPGRIRINHLVQFSVGGQAHLVYIRACVRGRRYDSQHRCHTEHDNPCT
jgi:hypothetical protein